MWFLILLITVCDAKKDRQILTRHQCQQLIVNHKPDDSVTYKSGVDVKGKAVAPADLPGNKTYGLGDKVIIPTEMPLKKFTPNLPAFSNSYVNSTIKNSSIYSSIIEVDKDGTVQINGETVQNDEQEKIRESCSKMYPDLN